jgi:hypothetical protein
MRSRAAAGLWAYRCPTPPDLDTDVAGASLKTAIHLADIREQVGRFAVTVIA